MDNCALYSPYATHTLLPPFSQCISLRCSVRSNLCTSLVHVTYHVCLRGSSRTENARARTDTFTIVFSHIVNTLSTGIESMEEIIEEPLHSSSAEKSERPEQNQDLRCQSGPSAKNSVIFSGGDSKNYGADQQRLQISDLHFDKFPTTATFACWKIRFKTEVRTCSQFPVEAMQWITEVELVDSVDELRSSSPTRGISIPNFEVLDARIASTLNKIIHNSQFKRRISLEERPRSRTVFFAAAYLIYDHFRVTGSHDSVENYTDLFTIGLRNDDSQEFDSKWDGILLSMSKIPHDDILEGLYKRRKREPEKHKTARNRTVWRFIRRKLDQKTQIENYGQEKYRARNSK